MAAFRSQSAMEYLMTYGWAILIVAIVMAAFYMLGAFSAPQSNSCLAQSGFLCSSFSFSANTVNGYGDPSITANLGTAIGPWTNVYFVVVPQGQMISNTMTSGMGVYQPDNVYYWGQEYGEYYYVASLRSGQIANARIYISTSYPGLSSSQPTLGTKLTGTIWAMYSTQSQTNLLAEVAVFTAVATSD